MGGRNVSTLMFLLLLVNVSCFFSKYHPLNPEGRVKSAKVFTILVIMFNNDLKMKNKTKTKFIF